MTPYVATACLLSFFLLQYIPFFCENQFFELFQALGFQYSNTRLAAAAVPWCAKADTSVIHKFFSVATRWLGADTHVRAQAEFDAKREDWKAAVLFVVLCTYLRPLSTYLRKFLRPSKGKKTLVQSLFLSVLQFVPLTGCLILMSDQSSQHLFLTSVVSLSMFLIAPSFKVKLVIVIAVNVIANNSVHIIAYIIVCAIVILAIFIKCCASIPSWSKKIESRSQEIEVVKQRFKDNGDRLTILKFFFCDLLVIFSVVCTSIALFVPFSTFYEIMVYCWTSFNFTRLFFPVLLTSAVASFHYLGKGEALKQSATRTRNIKQEIELLYTESSFIPIELFFNSMCIVLFNIVKGFMKLHKLSSRTLFPSAFNTCSAPHLLDHDPPTISPLTQSDFDLIFWCDCLCLYVLLYLHVIMLKKTERKLSSLAILALMDLNNLFYEQSFLEYHATPFMDLFSISFYKEVVSFLPFLWSVIRHSAPFLQMVRFLFSEFFTMFEDAARLAPAEVLRKELDTCYVIDFAGTLHNHARLNFSPVHGSAFLFYQPLNNHSSVGAFAMNINGSTHHIPTTAWTTALLNQPLSMCFKGKTETGHSQLYSVSSLIFRRFHQVKAELFLPSAIIFNTSLVPWVQATQWRATRYRESSLLPSRQRRGRLYCGTHTCRPVSVLRKIAKLFI